MQPRSTARRQWLLRSHCFVQHLHHGGGLRDDTLFVTSGISSTFQGDLGADSLYFTDSILKNTTIYGGNTSDATSADGAVSLWVSGTFSSGYLQANGGADTIYVGGTALSSSVIGGRELIRSRLLVL